MTIQEVQQEVKQIQISVKNLLTSQFVGSFQTAVRGTGLEFDEVRQYYYGDDIRRIDWNVSARTNSLFIKQYREERELNIHILVDVSRSQRMVNNLKWLKTLSLAASLGLAALHNRDSVSLASFSNTLVSYFPPTKQESQFWANLTHILHQVPENQTTNIHEALQTWLKRHPKRGVLFMISDCFAPGNYHEVVRILTRQHQLVVFRIVEPTFLPKIRGFLPVQDVETAANQWLAGNANSSFSWENINAEIVEYLQNLHQKSGIGVIQFDSNQDIFLKMQLFFSRPTLKQFIY